MRIAIMAVVIWGNGGFLAVGQPAQEMQPSGPGAATWAPVNSQKSLADAVGAEFQGETWEYPSGLLAREFPGFTYVSGPYDKGLVPKAQWRKPVILKNKTSGVELAINCYRCSRPRPRPEKINKENYTPAIPLGEPNYPYKPTEFHQLRAATASIGDHEAFVFRDGNLLFKIEATGSKAEDRRTSANAAAEAIWKFRQIPGKTPTGQAAPAWDAPPPPGLNAMKPGIGGLFGPPQPAKPGSGGTAAPLP